MKSLKRLASPTFILLLASLVGGCASYSSRIRGPRADMESGRFEESIASLKSLVAREDKDQLLYLMDLGMAYHLAGNYKEAIKVFLKADALAEIKDYTSLSAEVGSVVLSDEVKSYKGDDFEKILINVYLAIDFALANDLEGALVECRKVNNKLYRMIAEGQMPYEQNPFAKYLAATLFESQNELNDAFVDYRTLLKWGYEDYPYLPAPLMRVSKRLGAMEEFNVYKKKYPGVTNFRLGKNEGEIILILEQGKVPIKVPDRRFRLIPRMRKRFYESEYAWLRVGADRARTHTLFDVERTSVAELDHKLALITTKKIGGIVAKQAIGYGVGKATNSKELGFLTSLMLHLTDSADLRSWSTLPAAFQIARLKVPAGRQDVVLDMVTRSGTVRSGVKRWTGVEVKPGKQVFLNYQMRD